MSDSLNRRKKSENLPATVHCPQVYLSSLAKNTQCIRVLRTACEARLSLFFLGPEFWESQCI